MLRKRFFLCLLLVCTAQAILAETIQLKDKATVSGKILAEKHDQVVVDIGYTVLVIPRNQIAKISKPDAPEPAAAAKPAPNPKPAAEAEGASAREPKAGFYSVPNKPLPQRSVRDLVNQLGEAVVQVRTPGGLGSGFIINEDGFLMTNFHVIEGETQISVEVYHQTDGQLDRKTYKQIRIIAINKFDDLALLKIEDKDSPKFKYVMLGSSDALSVG